MRMHLPSDALLVSLAQISSLNTRNTCGICPGEHCTQAGPPQSEDRPQICCKTGWNAHQPGGPTDCRCYSKGRSAAGLDRAPLLLRPFCRKPLGAARRWRLPANPALKLVVAPDVFFRACRC